MAKRVTPMIHVPDVRATVDWYQDIGFTVVDTFSDDGEGLSWAMLSFGSSEVMFNEGGRPGPVDRRDVDLYVYVDNADELYLRLKDRVEVVAGIHDTFYGMREFIIRDPNRFWMTFGQPGFFETLMTAVRQGNTEVVRTALDAAAGKGELKPEMLTAALAAAATGDKTSGDEKISEIREMLRKAGAVVPPEVDIEILQSYAGR